MAISVTLPKDGEGFEAEIKIDDDVHLVLRAVHTGVGPVAGVFDAKTQKWAQREYAADIGDAKAEAEATAKTIARHLLRRAHSKKEFPPIVWQPR